MRLCSKVTTLVILNVIITLTIEFSIAFDRNCRYSDYIFIIAE